MRIAQAFGVSQLRDEGLQLRRESKEKKLAIELARDIFAEAEERGEPFLYHTPETWSKKWLPSTRFRLIRMPLNAAANPCEPKGDNLVLKKIHAMESKPIVVDFNKQQIGKSLHGFVPQIVVIDGKHRFKAAALRGETHIMAWVGEVALEQMHAMGDGGGGPAPDRTSAAPGTKLNAEVRIKNNPGMEADGKKIKELDVSDVDAYGTSEGAMAGWDVRGRRTDSVLRSSGFNHRGTDNGMHKYTGKTREKDTEDEKGRVINHTVWVDKKTGAWAHESGAHGLGMARGRGNGPDAKSLDKYIGSGKFHDTRALSRNGPVWNRIS